MEKIITKTDTIIKKYYPKTVVVNSVKVKSNTEIAIESGLGYSALTRLLRGSNPWNLSKPEHKKAFELVEEKCKILDESLGKDDKIIKGRY